MELAQKTLFFLKMTTLYQQNISLDLIRSFEDVCSLGEGINLNKNDSAWVDINNNRIHANVNSFYNSYDIKSKPSVIFQIKNNEILYGADSGIVKYDLDNFIEKILLNIDDIHNFLQYRSNDGGYCCGFKYLSFMHRYEPHKYPGYIYKISEEGWELIDNTVHIPNTFIEIENGKLLISDSFKREVWLYEFNKDGNLVNKDLWKIFEQGSIPDGGCKVDNFILIALWDNGSIATLDINGNELCRLPISAIRQTNCKYHENDKQLWVTSASEGLSQSMLEKFPLSGKTMVYKLNTN